MGFFHVLKEEWGCLTNGRYPIILIIFGLPLLFTVLFGFVYQENLVRHIPMVIYDEDQSSLSRTMIQAYGDSEKYEIVSYADSQEEMNRELRNGDAFAALDIPSGFSEDVKQGNSSEVLLTVDSANNIFANSAISAAREINRTFSLAVGQKIFEGTGVLPSAAMTMVYPVHIGVRILNNPTGGYTPFLLSGLMLNGLQISLMCVVGPLFCRIRLKKRTGPAYAEWQIPAGITVLCLPAALLSGALSLAVMTVCFSVPDHAGSLQLLFLGTAFSFLAIQELIFLAGFSTNEVMTIQIPLLFIMPGLLYSGLCWPVFSNNEIALWIGKLFPMTYSADTLRDLLLAGYAPSLWTDTVCMAVGGILLFALSCAMAAFRRKVGRN